MPYTQWVCLLVQCTAAGPCGTEKGTMLSAGKDFCRPLLCSAESCCNPYEESTCPDVPVVVSRSWCCGGVALLWEALSADEFILLEKRRDDYADRILQKNVATHLPRVAELTAPAEWQPHVWDERWLMISNEQEEQALSWREEQQKELLSPHQLELVEAHGSAKMTYQLREKDDQEDRTTQEASSNEVIRHPCSLPAKLAVNSKPVLSVKKSSSLQESWFCPGGPVSDAELGKV